MFCVASQKNGIYNEWYIHFLSNNWEIYFYIDNIDKNVIDEEYYIRIGNNIYDTLMRCLKKGCWNTFTIKSISEHDIYGFPYNDVK